MTTQSVLRPDAPALGRLALVLAALVPGLAVAAATWARFPASMHPASYAPFLKDFSSLWVSGRLYLSGRAHDVVDLDAFQSAIAAFLGRTNEFYVWFYPPHAYVLTTPFAVLPVLPAFLLWTILTLLVLALVLRASGVPHSWFVLLSPAAVENVFDGHNGALVAAAFVGTLVFADRRPILAGLFLSVLTIKPQLAVLAPVALLVSRRWRPLAWGLGFTLAWAIVAVLCFGIAPWIDYLTLSVPAAREFLLTPDTIFGARYFEKMMVTPYALVRGLGGGGTFAERVNLVTAALALAGTAWVWRPRSPVPERYRLAVILAAIPLVTPYALTYDMIGPSLACVILATDDPERRGRIVIPALGWIWPGVAVYFGLFLHQPGLGALVYAALAATAFRQTVQGRCAGRATDVRPFATDIRMQP